MHMHNALCYYIRTYIHVYIAEHQLSNPPGAAVSQKIVQIRKFVICNNMVYSIVGYLKTSSMMLAYI